MTSQEMRIFFKDYENYRVASELGSESQETQLVYLHLCLEPDVRVRAGTDDATDHAAAMGELEKLCFEIYNLAINRQIEVFRMTQSKTETATQVGLRVQNSYIHSDTTTAGFGRMECLLILRAIMYESVLKELHKDIARNMSSPKTLKEVQYTRFPTRR